jgi:cytochrome c oxidase cbb3-type subunit 2
MLTPPTMRPTWILPATLIGMALLARHAPGLDPAELLKEGKRVYAGNCAVCHGDTGNGEGPAAARLAVKPRDLRAGSFKFRSTPSGSLPRDEDLDATLVHGVRGTAMVPQRNLGADDRKAVIAYIKTFSERFAREQPQAPVEVPAAPSPTADLIARGRLIYRKAQCSECHGDEGRGDGPSAPKMKDDRGVPIAVPDFTRWPLKRASEPAALFRTIATGLNGTPMPSYTDALDSKEIWALVRYLESLVPLERRSRLHRLFPGEETKGLEIEEAARRAPAR